MAEQENKTVNKQQVLHNLMELGKKNGKITMKEINHAIDMLELDADQQDKFYAALEKMGVEIAVEEDDEVNDAESENFADVEEVTEDEMNEAIAVDGLAIDEFTVPRLTSVSQSVEDLANRSFQLLLEHIEDHRAARYEVLPVTLAIRESVREIE